MKSTTGWLFHSTMMLVLIALLSACAVISQEAPPFLAIEVTITPSSPTLDAPIAVTPDEPVAPTPTESGEIVLVVWMTEHLPLTSDAPGGQEFLEQLATFDELHPDIRVEVYTKRVSGTGGILSYLRTATAVAPSVLPDLALVDRSGLVQAGRENLVVPIGDLLDLALLTELYPVVQSLGSVDEELVGLPYLLEIEHSVYRETVFNTPPNSFETILRLRQPYAFPAGALGNVNNTILLQYLAAGGVLTDNTGNPKLDPESLTQVLTFYNQAHERGLIGTNLFQLTTPSESWRLYRDRQTNLAAVSSTTYLAERDDVRNTLLTWTPTPDGQAHTLATGWSWVVATHDPTRQSAVMSLVYFLMNPINQGLYSKAADKLPTRHAALIVWGEDDPYVAFADQLISNAYPMPDTSVQTIVGAAIQDALEAVLLNNVLPAQAAAQAEQSIGEASGQNP
ncbi:MAG: extracellular solute-binding protein [Anaerolineae bacterium]|nr:extracellular solute-binding protein [Anaerolineae bacterium]